MRQANSARSGDTKQTTITIRLDVLARITDYRFENRLETQSEAIHQILLAGLEAKKRIGD